MKVNQQKYTTEVINSQFCIKVGSDYIEIVYDHSHQVITVFVNETLVIQAPYSPRRNTFNYVNITEIAVKYRNHYYMKRLHDQITTSKSKTEED